MKWTESMKVNEFLKLWWHTTPNRLVVVPVTLHHWSMIQWFPNCGTSYH